MSRGFTLLELLLVIGIMGLLGTASVGGYRAMQRGMAERGVMDSVNSFIRAAYQRAQIDRQPTAVYFWNETIRASDDYNTELTVGKAVAIRRHGRLSRVEGTLLFDEFADLELSYPVDDGGAAAGADGGKGPNGGGGVKENTMYLYPIDRLSDIDSAAALRRSIVFQKVFSDERTPLYLSGENGVLPASEKPDSGDLGAGEMRTYAFKVDDAGGVTWKTGMAYGFEFAHLELPAGFIFGTDHADNLSSPVREAGTLVFDVGRNDGGRATGGLGSRSSIVVSELRPGPSGTIEPQEVGKSADPTEELK